MLASSSLLVTFGKVSIAVALGGVALAYLAVVGCQSSMIYSPRSYKESELNDARGHGVTDISFESSEGVQIAFYLPPLANEPGITEELWLITAGKGSVSLDFLGDALRWRSSHPAAAFLFIDYPGYGRCDGTPTPDTIRESVTGAMSALAAVPNQPTKRHIGTMGHSLGAAAALIGAVEVDASRAILISPFTSMADMVTQQIGAWAKPALRHRFDNRDTLSKLAARGVPVLFYHGENDRLIPPSMAESLSVEFPEIVEVQIIPRAGHGDIVGMIRDQLRDDIAEGFAPTAGEEDAQ